MTGEQLREILTHDQYQVFVKAFAWYMFEDSPYFIIPGYAGTGKTFLINILTQQFLLEPSDIAYAAYIGAAAINLVKSGISHATTIHKLIYDCRVSYDEDKKEKKIFTSLKDILPPNIKLIIIDEYSMLNDKIIQDILSFGIKTIFLGDKAQLPPIYGKNNLDDSNYYQLEEIVRQKENDGLIQLSFKARENIAIPYSEYDDTISVLPTTDLDNYDFAVEVFNSADQIICGLNKTRKFINNLVRESKDFTSLIPEVGDKVVCCQNNWKTIAFSPKLNDHLALVNGTTGIVTKVSKYSAKHNIFLMSIRTEFDPECEYKNLLVSGYNFIPELQHSTNFVKELDAIKSLSMNELLEALQIDDLESGIDKGSINAFDFGYAITCHKAQGQQYDKVVVIAENMFAKDDGKTDSCWLYTAITRAKKELMLFIDKKYYIANKSSKKDNEFWKKWKEEYGTS